MRKRLWLGIEDYSGLWEVVRELNTIHPEGRGGINEAAAQGAMIDALQRGWVRLHWSTEMTGDLELIPEEQHLAVALDRASWEPSGERTIRFETIEAGRAAHQDPDR